MNEGDIYAHCLRGNRVGANQQLNGQKAEGERRVKSLEEKRVKCEGARL